MIFSYLRVSSQSQCLNRQQQAIIEYAANKNIKIDKVLKKASGKDFTHLR